MQADFSKAMTNARLVFCDHAFRKWPEGVSWRNPINRPLFETWSLTLARYDAEDLELRKDAIVAQARSLMTSDFRYLEAITSSTGDVRRVTYRFRLTEQAAGAGK
jgi:hypothetical protein